MENRPNLLDDAAIRNATDNRKVHNDGGELPGCVLEIHIRNGGRTKRGYLRYNGTQFGEQRTARLPLGDYHQLGLKQLRRKRAACEALIEQGKNPKRHAHELNEERRKHQIGNITVAEAIEEFFALCKERRWGKRAGKSWDDMKPLHLAPIIASPAAARPLHTIDHTHVAEWLEPTRKKRGTNQKLHSFLHSMFEHYTARRIYNAPNPASWKESHPLNELLSPLPPQGRWSEMHLDNVPLIVASLMAEIEGDRPGFLTVAEAASAYGRDSTCIHTAIRAGKFPGLIKRGRGNLILTNELKATFGKFKCEPAVYEREDVKLCAYALMYQLLTIVRPGMSCELKWGQIKWDEGLIEYLPAMPTMESQHKAGHHSTEIYTVILTDGVRQILQAMQEWARQNRLPMGPDDYVFAHGATRVGLDVRRGRPLSYSSLAVHLKKLCGLISGIKNTKPVPHSVRYAFPKWAHQRCHYDFELVTLTLGHKLPAIEKVPSNESYFAGIEFIDDRREMMINWEKFAFSRHRLPQNVVPLRSAS